MHLLLFHGTEILQFFGGTIVGLGVFVGMLVWALRGPARPWMVPAIYLALGLPLSVAQIWTENLFALSIVFAFPWSVLLILVSTFVLEDDAGLVWMIPSVVINAVMIYFIARHNRR